jgi:uncharacterized phage-associated protein
MMNQYRRKLLNTILYFSNKKVKHLNTTKLSKLLYFLDFTHAKQTGYPAIGLEYNAFPKGPVPKKFWLEIKDGNVPADFKTYLKIVTRKDDFSPDYRELNFIAKTAPDITVFTPREQKILDELAFIYMDATAPEMSEISHLPNEPWDMTYRSKGKNAVIDYKLASESPKLNEHFEAVKNFNLPASI